MHGKVKSLVGWSKNALKIILMTNLITIVEEKNILELTDLESLEEREILEKGVHEYSDLDSYNF